jgi:hypothetical protein
MKRAIAVIVVLLVLASTIAMISAPALASVGKDGDKALQITTDPKYDRNPSFFRAADGTYWLFYARGRDNSGIRDFQGYNPDLDFYDIYYRSAKSIPGLQKASDNIIPLTPPDNAQRDIAALQSSDGTIWVFTSTGLGPGSERSIYYYTYDGTWHGPTPVPGTDYAAHISALEDRGRIWVFFDIGYALKVVSYDEATVNWSIPITIANPDATIAKAIVEGGKFYVVWTTASGTGIYLSTSADGSTWLSTGNPIASWPVPGTTNWDPVLIKDKNQFRLFWAPDAGSEGQFIATSSSTNPTDTTSWSAPVKMTISSHDTNSWWDFWPQPYTKGATYLFYTSERNSTGTDRSDANIWMMHITVPLTK